MTKQRSGLRTAAIVAAVVVVVLAAAATAASIYDHGRRDVLARGLKVDGVPVGGLETDAARERLVTRLVRPLHRTLQISASGHTFHLPAGQARVRVDVDGALRRAHQASREGWLGARVWRELTGGRVDRNLDLPVQASRHAVTRVVHRIARDVDRKPVDADVTPHAGGLDTKSSHTGRQLAASRLRRQLLTALKDPTRPALIAAPVRTLEPKTTMKELKSKYKAYIIIDRAGHVLRFYQHLELSRTYPIAVGKAGLEPPAGLYDIQWKEVNPPWRVPNSAWAGDLAGKVIPPGPDDPIKARWMAFNGGAGIHGIDPSEYGSSGPDATPGCVRMRCPDGVELYDNSPVHCPVSVA